MQNKTLTKRAIPVMLAICMAVPLTGCEMPTIFETKKDPYAIEELDSESISNDTYYVKSGTKFMAVYMPPGTVADKAEQPGTDRIIFMRNKESLIPTLYKGDTLAIKTTEASDIKTVTLERFRDCGYSIGVYGAVYDEESGMITLDATESIGENTPATQFSTWSDEISIETIGSQKVKSTMLDSAGNINCLEKDNTYEFGYYSGTNYDSVELTASQHTLESWEMFTISDIEKTKRGYLSINIPEDYKSGWYLVEGEGFFKYVDHERGDGDIPEGDEMNIEYYESEADAMSVYAQLYSVNFDQDKTRPTIEVIYNKGALTEGQTVRGIVVAPDGTMYDMEESATKPLIDTEDETKTYSAEGTVRSYLTCTLEKAMAGKWQVILTPKSIDVITVKVIDNGLNEQTTEVTKTFTFDDVQKQITFYSTYEGDGTDPEKELTSYTVFGYLIYPDGTTYNLEMDEDGGLLTYTVPYLPAGTYEVKMYHYSDVILEENDIGATTDTSSLHTESITNVSG